ncbi:MAG: hypothetical protein Q4D32_10385 [Eubacteriales bacterium]|nr:hypothetical protein [Eubacteriales bacterium]
MCLEKRIRHKGGGIVVIIVIRTRIWLVLAKEYVYISMGVSQISCIFCYPDPMFKIFLPVKKVPAACTTKDSALTEKSVDDLANVSRISCQSNHPVGQVCEGGYISVV